MHGVQWHIGVPDPSREGEILGLNPQPKHAIANCCCHLANAKAIPPTAKLALSLLSWLCCTVDISSNLLLQSLMRPLSTSEQQTMSQLSLATQPPQPSSTTTIRLNPLYGGAPLGPQPLNKDHLVRLAMLEAAYRHLPHPSDSERLRWVHGYRRWLVMLMDGDTVSKWFI